MHQEITAWFSCMFFFFFSPATHNPELCLPACHTPPIRATKETLSWSPEQDFIPFRKDSPEIPRGFSLPLCNLLSSNTPMKTVRLPCSLAPFLEDAVVKLAAPFTYTLYEFMPAYIKKLFWYKYLQCHYRLLAIKIRHNNNINHLNGLGSGWIDLWNISSRNTLKMAQYQTKHGAQTFSVLCFYSAIWSLCFSG